jgi:hypothetical protein
MALPMFSKQASGPRGPMIAQGGASINPFAQSRGASAAGFGPLSPYQRTGMLPPGIAAQLAAARVGYPGALQNRGAAGWRNAMNIRAGAPRHGPPPGVLAPGPRGGYSPGYSGGGWANAVTHPGPNPGADPLGLGLPTGQPSGMTAGAMQGSPAAGVAATAAGLTPADIVRALYIAQAQSYWPAA